VHASLRRWRPPSLRPPRRVVTVNIKRDRATNKNLGYGFVRMGSHAEACTAKDNMHRSVGRRRRRRRISNSSAPPTLLVHRVPTLRAVQQRCCPRANTARAHMLCARTSDSI
jgi:RNA recognition motif. (a.k.a. RRM, RBD, or RNP domain)